MHTAIASLPALGSNTARSCAHSCRGGVICTTAVLLTTPTASYRPEALRLKSGQACSTTGRQLAFVCASKSDRVASQEEDGDLLDVLPNWRRLQEDDSDNGSGVERAKQKFWGRLAVLGLGAILVGERLTGKGVLQSLQMSTGVPLWEIEPVLGLLVGVLVAAAVYPAVRFLIARGAQMSATDDSGGPDYPLPASLASTLSDSVQMVSGRVACLLLAGIILLEVTTGKGALTLLNVETGKESLSELEWGGVFLALLFLTEDVRPPQDDSDR